MVKGAAIVILTGAGISKESGLETFREEGGLWSRIRIEDVATPEAYARDPKRVLEFYNMRRQSMVDGNIRPNAAHLALARLERGWPGEVLGRQPEWRGRPRRGPPAARGRGDASRSGEGPRGACGSSSSQR